ncbi:6-phosphofructokinase [Glaciecola sp. MF2-115]|uniref:6-phosphofructokinase n=1 Tax=Glaciecola sp. MF2-115 TaxID=3384827 RepID=UPI0039A1B1C1
MRVGILTGGGDCPGINAAIRAVAKNLIINYKAEIIGIEDGFAGLIEERVRPLSYSQCSGILSTGGTILGTSNSASPLNYKGQDLSVQVFAYYQKLGLDALVVIGGDGTMSIANELSKIGMNIVGVPKTIDNDLAGTDQTFGFDTAVSIVTDALDRLRTTGQSHKRVMILETMGRYAGWIALQSGMAGGADVILVPEIPYDIDEVAKICNLRASEKQFSIIVVAEGAMQKSGEAVVRETIMSSPDTVRLGGVGNMLKLQLEQKIDSEIRSTALGHIQRGGSPTAFDRIFASNVGCAAASLVAEKRFGRVVVMRNNQTTDIPLDQAANKARSIPLDNMTLRNALSLGISFGDPDIVLPSQSF